MTTPSSHPNAHEQLLAAFVLDFEQRGCAAVAEYAQRHPALADEFRALASMNRMLDQSRPDPPAAAHPDQLGEFRIVRSIGHGGMGEIYEALQEPLSRRVAVKTIRQGRISPEARERFLREQKVLASLHQTHIVPIHTAGQEGNLHYFAMPYIEGAALHHVVRTALQLETAQPQSKTPSLAKLAVMVVESKDVPTGPTAPSVPRQPAPPAELVRRAAVLTLSQVYFRSVAQVMMDAAEAVQHAHGVQILHRDLKPSNLMVDTAGHCWIIDFGLAGYLGGFGGAQPVGAAAALSDDPVTVSGVLGTPHYMAPEQFDGKADVRTDVWGLGATLYELLTLRRAFDGEAGGDIRTHVLSRTPTLPRDLVANLPTDLTAICLKALRKEPGQRYQTAREFADDLGRWLRGEPTQARPAWVPRRVLLWCRRNKGWAAALVATLLLFHAFALGVFLIQRRESKLQELQVVRLTMHNAGWSDEAWKLGADAALIRKADDVRNHLAATLIGMDAWPEKSFRTGAWSVTFDPLAKRLCMGGLMDHAGLPSVSARLWDFETSQLHGSQQSGVGPVAFRRSDGAPLQLVADSKDRFTLHLWDMAKQQLVRVFKIPVKQNPEPLTALNLPTMTLTSDGRFVAASVVLEGDMGRTLVWDAESGKVIRQMEQATTALAITPDGNFLATGCRNGQITIWPLPQGNGIELPTQGRTTIHCLTFQPDLKRGLADDGRRMNWLLAAGDAGGTVTIWDAERKTPKSFCHGSPHGVFAVAFNPDGTILASAGRVRPKLWDVATGRPLLNLGWHSTVTGLAFSPDGERLAVAGIHVREDENGVVVWKLENGRGVQTLHGLIGQVEKVAFSADGRWLAGLSHRWEAAIWDLKTGHLRHVLEVPKGEFVDNASLAFDLAGSRFALAAGCTAKLWDIADGKGLRLWPLPPGLQDTLAFDPTGNKLLSIRVETQGKKLTPITQAPWEKHPRVCRVRDLLGPNPLEPIREIIDFNRHVFAITASPDGSYYTVDGLGGSDGNQWSIRTFDGPTGKELWSIPITRERKSGSIAALDPEGKILAFRPADSYQASLIAIPSRQWLGSLEDNPYCLSPRATYWARDSKHASGQTHGYLLFRRGEKHPLVTLGIDLPATVVPRFDVTGNLLAWGNENGTVTVCQLKEIQRRLARVGLGW